MSIRVYDCPMSIRVTVRKQETDISPSEHRKQASVYTVTATVIGSPILPRSPRFGNGIPFTLFPMKGPWIAVFILREQVERANICKMTLDAVRHLGRVNRIA